MENKAASDVKTSSEVEAAGTAMGEGGLKRRILVAEDCEDSRFLLQAYCKGTAYELTFVTNGEQAIAAYQSGSWKVVAMDVQMPVMDGLTAARRIRAMEEASGEPRIAIIALTAKVGPRDIEEASKAGCDAHLSKPVSKQQLLKALDHWGKDRGDQGGGNARSADAVVIDIPEGLEEFAGPYLASRQQELALFVDALERENFRELALLAHNWKGTGTSFGFPDITRLGANLEVAAKHLNKISVSQHIVNLSIYIAAAERQMKVGM